MATRIRTLNFLPEIFQTQTNAQFLRATLDVLVDQPSTNKIQGYVGSKFGNGINAKDYYVTEPTKTRTDYQLDPGVVFKKPNETVAQDFISYPGILDALSIQGANTTNNSSIFESQFYSWDSFANLDKLINFNQYYWLPQGPEEVVVSNEAVLTSDDFIVTNNVTNYVLSTVTGSNLGINPTLTLLRGGTYTFAVSQQSQFWIQGEPGTTGFSIAQPNIQTRDIYGVTNNGASQGFVTFQVPSKNAQDFYLNMPGNNLVDVVSNLPFSQVNGQPVNGFAGIDGVTSLNGLRVLFYNTGVLNEQGYTSIYYGETGYDTNDPAFTSLQSITITSTDSATDRLTTASTSGLVTNQTITFSSPTLGGIVPGQVYYVSNIVSSTEFQISITPSGSAVALNTDSGSMTAYINQGLFEEGYYSNVNDFIYRIEYIGDPSSPVIRLVPDTSIPSVQKITASFGTTYISRSFFKNTAGYIEIIPYISAILDTLYYQDSVTPGKVGTIKLIDDNVNNTLDVETDILGKINYTSTNGVVFTNGLKVVFEGDVIPTSYKTGAYYVEGVGTAIELLPVEDLVVPEPFSATSYIPWDTLPYDMSNWDGDSYIPVNQDYITIARNSINKNAWSRSNRWFHKNVLNATATYNNNPDLATLYITEENKAKRPIIEFYPNLQLYNFGTVGKAPVDFIDFRTTDAFTLVAGKENYYPDVQGYTEYTATIASVNYSTARTVTQTSASTNEVTLNSTTGFRVNDAFKITTSGGIGNLLQNVVYYISEIVDGTHITLSDEQNGDVKTLTTDSVSVSALWTPLSTTVSVVNSDINGMFDLGAFVADSNSVLPSNSQIIDISGTTTITYTVAWPLSSFTLFSTQTNASIIATPFSVDNYALFDGARVIFAVDEDVNVKNKIYVARFSILTPGSTPVITLTEAEDGDVFENDAFPIFRGYENQGQDFYFNGTDYLLGQQKTTVNQAPLFDIFDYNGVSLSNRDYYQGSSFVGSKLFSYGIGSGINDIVLGFPLRYSSINNVADISFDVNLNSDTFNYVANGNPITENINIGYVYNTTGRDTYVRQLGWQTAAGPSFQYQLFTFNATANLNNSFLCDIVPKDISAWPTVQVYVNNELLPASAYGISVGLSTTSIILNEAPVVDTVIQVLIYSDQTSDSAYYIVPINLSNNPLNENPTRLDLGDIRSQYQSIFTNNPSTTGLMFGNNNYNDLGNLVPYGTNIVQHSASLVTPGALLRKNNHNLFEALLFNNREYIKYKTLLVDTAQKVITQQTFNPASVLDQVLDVITSSKTQNQPFFWTDMVPNRAPYVTNTYTFANSLDVSSYPLTQVYNFETANYNSVLVYLTRTVSNVTTTTQLIRNIDYTVSAVNKSLRVETDLLPNDIITIKEYNQTYGSYVPATPTKLGLYPASVPTVILDSDYYNPTYFILGHDGSYTKLYGDYNPVTGVLVDFRDQILLEFEKRIYNNLKLSATIPIQEFEVMPGYFRDFGDYSGNVTGSFDYAKEIWDDFIIKYSPTFLDWVGTNRIDYKTQFYNRTNEYTYNYRNSEIKDTNNPIIQGYWRGVYQYFYDTTTPNLTPWEMLGYKNQPTWWNVRYGAAPYTSNNLVLWEDLELGFDYNNGSPRIIPEAARPGLLDYLPVDSNGNLLSPFKVTVGNYTGTSFRNDWIVGDMGPAELSYRRSSSWPFDLMRIMALVKPAKFYNLALDIDNYKYNFEFNQYLYNNRYHIKLDEVPIYGNGVATTSYLNWIIDYEKQAGINATENVEVLFDNLDVRLVYRLAGFSDKTLLKFYVEKGSPNSNNASLLIPDESYQVLLYDNPPVLKIRYTGIIVQSVDDGYTVYGNSQNQAYFLAYTPNFSTGFKTVTVENLSAKIPSSYNTKDLEIIPYGTKFTTIQEVVNFIMGYARYLLNSGLIFDEVDNGIPITWEQMVSEFLYWAQTGWEVGTIVSLNPAAKVLKIDNPGLVVEPLTVTGTNFVLNENLYPIQIKDLSINRNGTFFSVTALNNGDTVGYVQFNSTSYEHGIVFSNTTLFGDEIYNLVTGLRQNRIYVAGTKTAEWDGTVTTSGFVLNQDNILEWNREVKYTKGEIVKYKNKYWAALTLIQAKEIFDENDWKRVDYDDIQKGLLPNASTRAYESTLYYNCNQANLEQDADLLSFSLIGYRPRDYLALADLTDITQINVYKNLIKNKGTLNSVSAFKGANLPQGGIDYEVYENWAIKSGEFGAVLNSNFVEFRLDENVLTGNPSLVALTDGTYVSGVQQQVPTYSLFNYARPINSPNVLPTISAAEPSTLFPDAGYVNLNDVKLSSFYYSQLPIGVDKNNLIVPLNRVYVRDYIWIADYLGTWQVYTPQSLGQITTIQNNKNGTVTVTFKQAHNLSQYSPLLILNFNNVVNGYHIVTLIVDPYRVIINLTVGPEITILTGLGIGLTLQTQRVEQPSDIIDLPLLDSEFIKNKVWVDINNNGAWAVYRKSINYLLEDEITVNGSQTLGSAVAYTNDLGYLISDANAGIVYRYTFNSITQEFAQLQSITQSASFGSQIAYSQDIFVITEPDTPKIYTYQLQTNFLSNALVTYQPFISGPADAVAISGDTKWIFASDLANNTINVYRQNYLPTTAGYFTVGQTFVITSVGTTDFTAIGATTNDIGTIFVSTGVGSGTGTATLITYALATSIDGDALGLTTAGDNFGYSISTNYYGDTLVVGTPGKEGPTGLTNLGYAFIFNRAVQNIEVNLTVSTTYQEFQLSYSPPIGAARTASATNSGTNRITCNASMTGFTVNDPVIFQGTNFGTSGVQSNKVYYINSISGSEISIKESRTGSVVPLTTAAGLSFNVYVQTTPIFVSVNGNLVTDNNYAIVNDKLVYTTGLNLGDIIQVSGQEFILNNSLTTLTTPRIGAQFGTSVDTNIYGSEILVGAPFYINDKNQEGAIYRYSNAGAKYGTIIGLNAVNVTVARKVLINNYLVTIPAGNATVAANAINAANITNVQASATTNDNTGKLIISLVNNLIASVEEKLTFVALNNATYAELGFTIYQNTQFISCPHNIGPTQFGSVIKFNEYGSFIASAITGTRYSATTFDFSDDEFDNDTVFDNNATQFVDTYSNAGAVYMFDYLSNNNESLVNLGKFVYAQSVNDNSENYGSQPYYGTALDFNNDHVIVGTPNFLPSFDNGKVTTFVNPFGADDWSVYRSSSEIVNIDRINTSQIFSAESNNTLVNLDYIDPLQGKILGVVRQNIDIISNQDPARYNNIKIETNLTWTDSYLGQLWLDTSEMRYINYHQDDVVYNSQYWGALFPNSNVKVFTWVSSPTLPINYPGPGVPYDVTKYSINYTLTANGSIQPIYYFWVKNTNIISSKIGKTLSDSICEVYIANSQGSGISYFAPLLPNAFGLYNCQEFINANDSVFHVSFATGVNDDATHNQFDLIRAGYKDDFLPGLPQNVIQPSSVTHANFNYLNGNEPSSLYARLLDSLSGLNLDGAVVPDYNLPKAVQLGVLARPRQTFFYERLEAVKNYLQFANEILRQYPITEIRTFNLLFRQGAVNPSTINNPQWTQGEQVFFDTSDYWEYVNWWADGYNDNTKSLMQVPVYADLSTLNVAVNSIVTVTTNGNGLNETYIYNENNNWVRIGLQNGTIRFKTTLWDYTESRIGFGDNFYDTSTYDDFPSEPTRYIVRSLVEEIFTDDLLIYRNEGLILLFKYIQSETIENQNYLPWLNKTSFIDVQHSIRELLPYRVFASDQQDFLQGYINETKPYHAVVKEFVFLYKGTDVFEGDITDFDLPAEYNSTVNEFITPALIFQGPGENNQFTTTSGVWSDPNYSQWYNNYGLSLTGINDYPMTTLASYITTNTGSFVVENASGLPINGVLKLTSLSTGRPVVEYIGYNLVDYNLNVISGLVRGVNGTTIQNHIPGQEIIMDLPAVILLNSGRGYLNPPKVTVYVDPNYTKTAEFTGFIVNKTLTVVSIASGESIIVGNYIHNSNVLYGTQIVAENDDGTYELNISQTLANQTFIQYVGPREFASLRAVMGGDKVLSIEVLNPGAGYVVQPEIIIEPAESIQFSSSDVSTTFNTIRIYAPNIQTGDLIKYTVGSGTVPIGGLQVNQWYYVHVLETSPLIIIALYSNYTNAINDTHRIDFLSTGSGVNHFINLGARGTCIVSSQPVRENNTTLRFDRTTYDSQVIDWEAGRHYGAYYAGEFINTQDLSSSSVQLQSTQPPIDSITASAQGVVFEIVKTGNQRTITFDSVERNIASTISAGNIIRLSVPTTLNPLTASKSTIGFYVGMPIKFTGVMGGSGITPDVIYYVQSVVDYRDFVISTNPNNLAGTIVTLTNFTASSPLNGLPGALVDLATVSVTYPGLTSVTATAAVTNKLTIPLNASGTGGTNGFYVGLPIFFTKSVSGNVFGGIVENDQYYVTTVCDKQTFTMSKTSDPTILTMLETDSATDEITIEEPTDNLNVNDPIIFTNFVFEPDQLVTGQEYTIKFVGTTDFSTVATPSTNFPNQVGTRFIANGVVGTGTGTVTSNYWSNIEAGQVYYISEITGSYTFKISTGINLATLAITNSLVGTGSITSQVDTYPLTTATGDMVININLPVSPGQVNGQKLTFYKTGSTFTDIQGTITPNSIITRDIGATVTVASGSYSPGIVSLTNLSDGVVNYYINMPVIVDENFGNLTTTVTAGSFVVGQSYKIATVGSTTWTSIGGTQISAGSFDIGTAYIINAVGTTDFTLIGAASNTVGVTFTATGPGTGTGTALESVFTASGLGTGTGTAVTVYYVNEIGTITVDCTSTSNQVEGVVTGSITGSILTVTAVTSGIVQIGSVINGTGVTVGTFIESQQSGTPGGIGTYNLNIVYASPVSSTTITVSTGIITCTSTAPLFIDMPIVFSGVGLGNLNIDFEYYVLEILSATTFTVSVVQGGYPVILTSATGIMTGTGEPYVKLASTKGGTDVDPGNTQTTCTISIASPAVVTVAAGYVPGNGVKISFRTSGSMPTGLTDYDTYYVINSSIPAGGVAPGTFQISLDLGGAAVNTSAAATAGSTFKFVIEDTLQLEQQVLADPVINVSYKLGGYIAYVNGASQGLGWAVSNQIEITGDLLGGTTPTNDLVLTVNDIDIISIAPITNVLESNGNITQFICEGTPPSISNDYYCQILENVIPAGYFVTGSTYYILTVGNTDFTLIGAFSNTVGLSFVATGPGTGTGTAKSSPYQFKLYENQLLTIPVSGITLPYDGVVSTTATNTTTGTNLITVTSTAGFNLYDPIVFTGTTFGGIEVGVTYYIRSIPSGTTITVYDSYNYGPLALTTASGSMLMTTQGDYAFLPQPFYFTPSIVKYNNQAWECIVSNNDTDFVLGKWQLLTSGDRQLNALDRIKVYYAPTDNMPGVNLPELVSGIEYPNATYLGNPFAPGEQFNLDTIIPAQEFLPTPINLTGVIYGASYLATYNLTSESGIARTVNGTDWDLVQLTNVNTGLTGIFKINNKYFVTSSNAATPLYVSDDSLTWASNGAIVVNSQSLSSVTYGSTYYFGAGSNIVRSTDTTNWIEVFAFNNSFTNNYNAIAYVNIPTFNGVIAVGKGQRFDYSGPLTQIVNTNLVNYSINNFDNSNELSTFSYNGLNAIAVNSNIIVAAGENGVIYTSINPSVWTGLNERIVVDTNGIVFVAYATTTGTNLVTVSDTNYLSAGLKVQFSGTNFGGLVHGTIYYVNTINTSTNQISLCSDPGLTIPVVLSTASAVGTATFFTPDDCTITLQYTTNLYAADEVTYTGPSFGGLINGATYYIGTITGNNVTLFIDALLTNQLQLYTASSTGLATITKANNETINALYWDNFNNLFIAAGNNGTVLTSSNGTTWTVQTSGVASDLTGIDSDEAGEIVIVGENNIVITSTDAGVTWTLTNTFEALEPVYTIQGDEFSFGYGPEELVPGVVTDSIMMTVNTRPGTNWPATEYAHVGFNAVSVELTPNSGTQTEYSFANIIENPAQLRVAILSSTDELGTTIYETVDYTINWIDQTISLINPIATNEKLRIDCYETGNGDQLVKSSTKNLPIRDNSTTGWNEIYLNCYYEGSMFTGGGVIQDDTNPITILATGTDADTNTIAFVSVENLDAGYLNDAITFTGGVVGGLLEDTTYFIKTINRASNTITVSQTLTGGIAGPTLALTTGTGSFYGVVRVGASPVYTPPLVYHNGVKLVNGFSGTITRTKNAPLFTITCNSTSGLSTGLPIVFSDTMFGSTLTPQTTYYIASIYDANEFRVSNNSAVTPAGSFIIGEAYAITTIGSTDYTTIGATSNTVGLAFIATGIGSGTGTAWQIIQLDAATGGAEFITNDYSFGIQPDGIHAKMIFAAQYDATVDYLNFTVFGETTPTQYGYTIPEVQNIVADGSVSYGLSNYISLDSVTNAIVEIDGLRLLDSQYTISNITNSIQFSTAPTIGQNISVTTYNLTERQYLKTQFGIAGLPGSVSVPYTVARTTNENTSFDALVDANQLMIGQEYIIDTVGTTDFTKVGAASNTVGVTFTPGLSTIATAFVADDMYDILTLGTTTISDWTTVGAVAVNAGVLVIGEKYIITNVGTTDFTLVGAVSNTVGGIFTATGVGSGTGTTLVTVFKANGASVGTGTASCFSTTGTGIVTVGFNSSSAPVLVTAGSFVAGIAYTITVIGSTDFTLIGAASNTVGLTFVATGIGTGTGTATTIPNYTVNAGSFVAGIAYEINNLGTTTDWNVVAGTSAITYASGDTIIAVAAGSGDGTADILSSAFGGTNLSYLTLESGDTSTMVVNDKITFASPVIGGIQADVNYYITSVINGGQFTVSQTVGGLDFEVYNDTGSMSTTVDSINVANIISINNTITPYLAVTNVTATTTGTNEITCDDTTNFVVNQTVQFKITTSGSSFGGISALGTMYYVESIVNSTTFTIKDENGNQISLSTDSGLMVAYVGGRPAVTVTTGIPHLFSTNDLVRIDGTVGSVQLNNNVFYVHVINSVEFELYEYFPANPSLDYSPYINEVNYPITVVNSYISGGYTWLNGLFVLSTVIANSTTAATNVITVASGYLANVLTENTPIYFTESSKQIGDITLGGLEIGKKYFVKDVSTYTFKVSETIGGDEVALTTTTGTMNCTEWEQTNVDRLYVTLNGYRVPSSKLKLNPANFLSILTEIVPGDVVTITSMMPSATPNEETYLLNVNKNSEASVYRANVETKTWLTQDLLYTDETIYVNDASKITETVVQNEVTPAAISGYRYIGLSADKEFVSAITVYNSTTSSLISSSNYTTVLQGLNLVLKITNGAYISTGDNLIVTIVVGNLIFVNGEQIKFETADVVTNTLTGITRGVNNTGMQNFIAKYSEVYSLLPDNRLSDTNYNITWNPIPGVYNETLGDPLQIAETASANFLNQTN